MCDNIETALSADGAPRLETRLEKLLTETGKTRKNRKILEKSENRREEKAFTIRADNVRITDREARPRRILVPCTVRKPKTKRRKKRMNKYELALVVSAKIDDEARAAVVEKAKDYITRVNGVIGEVEEWGKKRLAYEINHERDGFYYFIPFEAEPTAPAEIERHARIMDNVLRYLIVRTDAE